MAVGCRELLGKLGSGLVMGCCKPGEAGAAGEAWLRLGKRLLQNGDLQYKAE